MVKRIGELETLAVNGNWNMLNGITFQKCILHSHCLENLKYYMNKKKATPFRYWLWNRGQSCCVSFCTCNGDVDGETAFI
jgi:hypothetical protein